MLMQWENDPVLPLPSTIAPPYTVKPSNDPPQGLPDGLLASQQAIPLMPYAPAFEPVL